MQGMQSESPAEGARLWLQSMSCDRTMENESGDSFYGRGASVRNLAALFMPTTPFREGDVCDLFGQVFWLSDRSKLAPSHRKRSPVVTDRIQRFHSGSLQVQSPITAAGPRRNPDFDASVTVFPFHSQPWFPHQQLTRRTPASTQTASIAWKCHRRIGV